MTFLMCELCGKVPAQTVVFPARVRKNRLRYPSLVRTLHE